MKDVTQWMINSYGLDDKGYDFMGYTFTDQGQLSFHHLIVPKKDCPKLRLGNGYFLWNGAILKQLTAHNYLHTIEKIDRNTFLKITQILIAENQTGEINIELLKQIRFLLEHFEKEHYDETDKKGKILIKSKYITERIPL